MLKPPTGEPCAGEPHARFGGRGESILFPTPIIPPALLVVADFAGGKLLKIAFWKGLGQGEGCDALGVHTMRPIHPGRILNRGMAARVLSANKLFLALRVPSGRITQILAGKHGISAETALWLAKYFGNSAQLWINLQSRYDLASVEQKIDARVYAEVEQAAV